MDAAATFPSSEALAQRLLAGQALLAVVGLGYVGLPLAVSFARAGFTVHGVEIDAVRRDSVARGENPLGGEEPGLAEALREVVSAGRLVTSSLRDAARHVDVVLIEVATPIDAQRVPRYEALRAVCMELAPQLRQGMLVVVESTVAPGTMDRLVRPLLEQGSGMRAGIDFFLGHCPERVMPGKLLHNLRTMARVCGGVSPQCSALMRALYQHIVDAELDLADCVTAEMVKTAENAYRDVNIAFANELALLCERSGAAFLRVRELVNKSPGRQLLLAGGGVGGHCIPKDSWLLAHAAEGFDAQLLRAARARNDAMPAHVLALVEGELRGRERAVAGSAIAVLGVAYLEDSDDARESPSLELARQLQAVGATVRLHDPHIAAHRGGLEACVRGVDAAVLMVAHRDYRAVVAAQWASWLAGAPLIDARHVVEPSAATAAGLRLRSLGRAR